MSDFRPPASRLQRALSGTPQVPVGRRLVGGRRAQQRRPPRTGGPRAASPPACPATKPIGTDSAGVRDSTHAPVYRASTPVIASGSLSAAVGACRVALGEQQEVAARQRVEHAAPPGPLPLASAAVVRAADGLAAAQSLQDVVGEDLRAVAQALAMDPRRLGQEQLGRPLDRLVEPRELDLHELRAQALELGRGRRQERAEVGVELVLPGAEHAHAQAADAHLQGADVVADGRRRRSPGRRGRNPAMTCSTRRRPRRGAPAGRSCRTSTRPGSTPGCSRARRSAAGRSSRSARPGSARSPRCRSRGSRPRGRRRSPRPSRRWSRR